MAGPTSPGSAKHNAARPVGHHKPTELMSASESEKMRPQGVPDLGPLRSTLNNASKLFRKGNYGGSALKKSLTDPAARAPRFNKDPTMLRVRCWNRKIS